MIIQMNPLLTESRRIRGDYRPESGLMGCI